MKLTVWVATAAVTTALVAAPTAAFAAAPTAPTTVAAASGDCNFGERVFELWRQLPIELRADLKALRDLPPSERRDRAIEIRQHALEGDYGVGVQERLQLRKERRALAVETMPIELKHALLDLRNADPADRRDLAKQIADDAIAGEYGTHAQETVERIRNSDFWQECIAD